MSEINLDDGKIKYEDAWYSADELSGMIQEKMESGEMKFAGIAAALEEYEPELIAAGHCTGEAAEKVLAEKLGSRFRSLRTGVELEL